MSLKYTESNQPIWLKSCLVGSPCNFVHFTIVLTFNKFDYVSYCLFQLGALLGLPYLRFALILTAI